MGTSKRLTNTTALPRKHVDEKYDCVQYLRVPLKRQAINKPGTPYSDPNTCITK